MNRVQTLRSSTAGAAPAAGTRAPGELWTNFPDLQLGVIDASKNAQRLIAVRYFSTTANYATGDFVIQAGALYTAKAAITAGVFNSTQWTKVAAATDAGGPYLPIAGGTLTGALVLAADPGAALGAATKQYVDGKVTAAPYLPLAGGTMTGLVTLSGPPTIPLHAATKAYVDAGAFVPIGGGTMTGDLILNRNPQVPLGAATKQYVDVLPVAMNDNRLVNGDMRTDQRGIASGAGGTTAGYTVDRWAFGASATNKGQWSRPLNGPPPSAGFSYSLRFLSTSAYVVSATDQIIFYQPIEADQISDFQWGSANAQPVTLSFWAFSSLTGTFSGALQNYAQNRSYPFSYSLTANTWAKVVITIPGDTAGSWVMSGNVGAAYLVFDLGSGTTSRGLANAWASAAYTGVTGSVSVVATNGAQLLLTGVKLEIGSAATPFNRQSLAKSMADCQRYYSVTVGLFSGNVTSGQNYFASVYLPVSMRAAPTLTGATVGGVSSFPNAVGTFIFGGGAQVQEYRAANASAMGVFSSQVTASAEL